MKSKRDMIRDFIHARRVLRGPSVTAADCGVAREKLLAALRRTELLCNMPDNMGDILLDAMEGRQVREGAVLFREGSRGDSLLLKAAGTVRVSQLCAGLKDIRVLATLNEPAVLGQEAFYGVDKRAVTVRMLTAGTVFPIRRGTFAEIVADGFVTWCELDAVPLPAAHLLWIGDAATRPKGLSGIPCITVDRIKRYVREAPADQPTFCCAREDTTAAFAAFLLAQHGVATQAVRQGRKLSISGTV